MVFLIIQCKEGRLTDHNAWLTIVHHYNYKQALTITGDDLGDHQLLRLMGLPVGTAREPLLALTLARGALVIRASGHLPHAQPVAVQTNHKATLVAHPVEVEEGGVARVAHLTHALHSTFPGHLGVRGHPGHGALLLLHQLTEAVPHIGHDVLGHLKVNAWLYHCNKHKYTRNH